MISKLTKKCIRNIRQYKFLFSELVKRDFSQKYKRTSLGMAWSVLSPLLTLLVMKIVFTKFFSRDMPHYTTYLFSGNLVMAFYKEATKNGMDSLMKNSKIIEKINLPKYLFLLSKNISALVNFALTLVVYFLFCILDRITFTPRMILLIYPIICLTVMNIGIGMILSALYVFFRDIRYLYDVFLTLLTYLSAIFYPVDRFSPHIQKMFLLNPVYVMIKYFRTIVIDMTVPSLEFHLLCLFYALFYLALGSWVYKKYNNEFIYYL
ncbi:ABC-2 type transport system permease protein [Butyrivibrio sp. ob235]|uniref:ABC transporter permease n=1 Tax=Butyrivibrio sp. ob235 TaxID=1761780 RepID=UPI0008BF067C|nr:ABC transporter permease [Butyrivibrio sp. ob235]SEL81703.1 ABC-2 type transport system permease protein [Butyrivibrio sp. ob235]